MNRIGLLGGTFNPIHKGHLNIAKSALRESELDEVWFIPNGCPPHKTIDNNITAISRYNMVFDTIKDVPGFVIKDIELSSLDYNYTHDTLRMLSDKYPDTKFYFIIGEDSLDSFANWRKPDIICKYATILVATRSDNNDNIKDRIDKLSKRFNGEFILLNCDFVDVSSTDIREKIRLNEAVADDIDPGTLKYINNHMVYEDIDINSNTPYLTIMDDLSKILKPTRFEHTIGVMHTAINLGMRYDVPLEMCRYAGLLHDAAKSYTKEELIAFCEDKHIEITDSEYKAPHLLHGKVGAYIAQNKYNINDERILNAIINHTTGRPEMTLLEQIVFVADYIEPRRSKAFRLNEIRAMAYYNIDIATAMILKDTINYLKDIDAFIDDKTIKTYEYYQSKISE